MDLLEKRPISQDLYGLINKMKFRGNTIEILGSASLKSQQNAGDTDLYSKITGDYSPSEIYNEILRIIDVVPNTFYFVEAKLQDIDGEKIKYQKPQVLEINKRQFIRFLTKGILAFIKLDFVVRDNYLFKELSIIYNFDSRNDEHLKNLTEDYEDYKKEGQYYKALKRQFSISKLKGDKKTLLRLTRYFNGEIGKKYKTLAHLKAIKLLREKYKDTNTLELIKIALKDLGFDPEIKMLDTYIQQTDEIVNTNAKRFFH